MPQPRRRSAAAAAPTVDTPHDDGPMGSFGGLRNWLFAAVVGLLMVIGSVVMQDSRNRIDKNEAAVLDLRSTHEKDLRELRDRWNAEYQGILQTQGQNGERLGK